MKVPPRGAEEDRPPLPEEPPLPDEGERVFHIPDPPPVRTAEKSDAQTSGDASLWTRLLDDYKGRLPVNHRVFLNMAKGVLRGDVLTVQCSNDFVRDSLNNESVLRVLREVTSTAAGKSIRVELTVGAAKGGVKANTATPAPAAKVPDKPAEAPPWEAPTPTTATHDRLDELEKNGSRLDHFKIK